MSRAGEFHSGRLSQYDHVEVKPNVVHIQHGDYAVMVMNHGSSGSAAYMSHRPGGNPENGMSIGEARFDGDGTLSNIGVDRRHQQRGVGTMVWDAAQALAAQGGMPTPKHSPERTEAGEAFARRVGGDLPERKVVYRN